MLAPGMSATGDRYTHGHHASVVAQHARRTAERDAAYLLPHLRPGERLLDIGCGPGTITTGLARAVAPGETIGIDLVPAVLDEAREHAESTGVTNARFEEASVYALPYDDGAFDAVHAHQVMQHLGRPVDALREALRVLRPGGVIGIRDSDYATMIHSPHYPELDRWLELYHAVTKRNGVEADAGRNVPAWLRAAGCDDIAVTGSGVVFATREEVLNWGDSWAQRIVESAVAAQALEYGLATRADLEAISDGWRRWARDPDALFMYMNVECVGTKAG